MHGVELGVIVISTIAALAFMRFVLSIIAGVTWYAVRPLAVALVVVTKIAWWIARACFGIAVVANRAFRGRARSVRSSARTNLRDSSGDGARPTRSTGRPSTG